MINQHNCHTDTVKVFAHKYINGLVSYTLRIVTFQWHLQNYSFTVHAWFNCGWKPRRNQVRAVNTDKVHFPKYLKKTDKNDLSWNYKKNKTQSKGLNLWRSKSSHTDRITGNHTHTQGQSCELCLTVTMAKRDPSQGSSWAAPSPKAKDVPLNLWTLSSLFHPNPPTSRFQGAIFHLHLFPFLFFSPFNNFLCPVFFFFLE